jgi:hypothetical protein
MDRNVHAADLARFTLSSEERREGNSFKAFSIDMLCIIIATLQGSFLSYVFLFAGHYGREKEARSTFFRLQRKCMER